MAKQPDVITRFSLVFTRSPGKIKGHEGPLKSTSGTVGEALKTSFNYVIEGIADRTTARQKLTIAQQIQGKMEGITQKELVNMGRKISNQAIGLGPRADKPTGGSLSIEGPISSFGESNPQRVAPMAISPVIGGRWRDRSTEYLTRKQRRRGHKRWWLDTGSLKAELKNPSTYTAAYGPVKVKWVPQKGKVVGGIKGRGRGGQVFTYPVGRIEMSILGRITTSMLAPPGDRAFNSARTGLFSKFSYLTQNKLYGQDSLGPRVIVEPFLTYYVNRQIPNRIMYEIDKIVKGS